MLGGMGGGGPQPSTLDVQIGAPMTNQPVSPRDRIRLTTYSHGAG